MRDEFYGDRTGSVLNRFGHIWHISTHTEDLSQEEIGRRTKELYGWCKRPGNSKILIANPVGPFCMLAAFSFPHVFFSHMQTTPTIPAWVIEDRFQPQYTNIYALLGHKKLTPKQQKENRRRLYCTETMDGFNDWDAPTLLLAKDAGPMQTFLRLIEAGDPQPWRHAQQGRDSQGWQTNDRLQGFATTIPGAKLYGSVMAGLLRNDGRQRGTLPNFGDVNLRQYLRRVLEEFVFPNMPKLRVVLCLGNDSC